MKLIQFNRSKTCW